MPTSSFAATLFFISLANASHLETTFHHLINSQCVVTLNIA